ncbi:unnamed protein product [Rotaria sp. Silwood2]|nr:unnamed protein product [Rotaria sp. Silwood2]
MASSSTIERQAIGRRNGFIGSLYDVRTDEFEGGKTFNKLDIEANLKLALMAGLINVEGSAKYLEQTKTNNHTVRVTFMYRAKTKEEYLQISTGNLNEYFSEYAFKNPNVTHVVIGIVWGINVAATFERTVESADAVQRIEGTLSAAFKKPIFSIKGQATIDYDDKNKSDLDSLKVEFSGDVLIDNCPQTVEGVLKVCENIPSQIESLNDGKGRQLVFILYPLKSIAQMFESELKIERSIKEVSEAIVSRIEDMFEQIIESKRKLNDFIYDIEPWKEFISYHWFDLVKQKQRELDQESLITQRKLKDLLVKIRSDSAKESEMQQLLDEFESNNPCSLTSIERFLKDNQKIKRKIDTLTKVSPEKKELLKILESVDDLILDLYDYDVYLLHTCEEWNTKENKRSTLKQERYFTNLMKNELISNNTKARFRVIDHDLHPELEEKPNSCVIYHAKNGHIVTRDFYEYSLSNQFYGNIINIHPDAQWQQDGITVSGGNGQGNAFNQLSYPWGLYVDDDETIYVADYSNHRITKWIAGETSGKVVAGGKGPGDGDHQLSYPYDVIVDKKTDSLIISDSSNRRVVRWPRRYARRGETIISDIACWGLTMDQNGSLYVVDNEKHEVRRYQKGESQGTIVAGGNGCGDRLDQLSNPRYVFVDQDFSVYVSEWGNNRVTKWIKGEKTSIVVAGNQESGNNLTQLILPKGVVVDQLDTVYVVDDGNDRVMRWPQGASQGSIIAGGNGRGEQSNQLNGPVGLSFDRHGNLYVVDYKNHRVQKFNIESNK